MKETIHGKIEEWEARLSWEKNRNIRVSLTVEGKLGHVELCVRSGKSRRRIMLSNDDCQLLIWELQDGLKKTKKLQEKDLL